MSRLTLAFFTTAALCALAGMAWGIQMGATETFTLAPAHAHLNLLGWTSLALMGGFYALAGDQVSARLGWVNFGLSAIGVVVLIPSLALLLASGKPNLGVMLGSALSFLGMATFLVAVISAWRSPRPAQA